MQIEKTCGRCQSTTAEQQDQPETTPMPLSIINTPAAHLLTRRTQSLQLVTLESHCLPDYHFSHWGNWSACLPVCRKVRFRHCTTSLCKERVPHMEDKAVKQEEWCIPSGQAGSGKASCQGYLALMSLSRNNGPAPMELKQCEKARRKQLQDEQRKKSGGKSCNINMQYYRDYDMNLEIDSNFLSIAVIKTINIKNFHSDINLKQHKK